MKIAVCYRGLLRTFAETFASHQTFFNNFDQVDYFLHTWNAYPNVLNWAKDTIPFKHILVEKPINFQNHCINSIIFNHSHEPTVNHKISENGLHVKPYSCLSMLYSINQAFLLSQIKPIEYDFVCILRPDISFSSMLEIKDLNKEQVNISWYQDKTKLGHKYSIIDHISIGTPDIINEYRQAYNFLYKYYIVDKIEFVPEIILGYHLHCTQIDVNMIDYIHDVKRIKNYDPNDCHR